MTTPTPNTIYTVTHPRKGAFTFRVVEVIGEYASGVLVDPLRSAIQEVAGKRMKLVIANHDWEKKNAEA